jgi:hypothetical protein
MKVSILIIILFSIGLVNCKSDTPENNHTVPLVFSSLTSEKDTIVAGETTLITAEASGYLLSFYWSTTAGNILGNGSFITYTASPCQAGNNIITCKIKDGNNQSLTKEINIFVE